MKAVPSGRSYPYIVACCPTGTRSSPGYKVGVSCGCGLHVGDPMLEREVSMVSSHEDEQNGAEPAVVSAPTTKPAPVVFPDDLTAMQVDCGTFHTGECWHV
jgi:hypothetical protein